MEARSAAGIEAHEASGTTVDLDWNTERGLSDIEREEVLILTGGKSGEEADLRGREIDLDDVFAEEIDADEAVHRAGT